MEKWIKILETNFQLFRTNNDLIVFLSVLRLCDEEGMLDSTMTKLCATARLEGKDVKDSLNSLFMQGLISGNSDGNVILCRLNVDKKKWIGGDRARQPKKEEELSPTEKKFRERLQLKFDRIAKMDRPLLLSEYNEISTIYSQEQILETMLAMQNHADLIKKYTSAKLTLINWLRRRYGK